MEYPWTALSSGVKAEKSFSRPWQSSEYKKVGLVWGRGGKGKEKTNG